VDPETKEMVVVAPSNEQLKNARKGMIHSKKEELAYEDENKLLRQLGLTDDVEEDDKETDEEEEQDELVGKMEQLQMEDELSSEYLAIGRSWKFH
jgi:hypothetical protein